MPNIKINRAMAEIIFGAALKMCQLVGKRHFGDLGIIDLTNDREPEVLCLVPPFEATEIPMGDVLVQLKAGKRGIIGDRFVVNTFNGIAAVKVGKKIVIFYSHASGEANEAVAVVYGLYHNLLETRGSIVDDVFSDMLLCHLGQWQKNNRQKNEILLPLAQSIFKPELAK